MEMGPERSKSLHNFTLPCGLKWGNQRFLRCLKVSSNGEVPPLNRRSSAPEVKRHGSIVRRDNSKAPLYVGGSGHKSKPGSDADREIEAVRAKLMFDLQTAADKMKDAILRNGLEKELSPEEVNDAEEESTATVVASVVAPTEAGRTWNLRSRRAADNCGRVSGSKVDTMRSNLSPTRIERTDGCQSLRLRGAQIASPHGHGEKRERAMFSVPLLQREIDEDFMSMTGHRPLRRPKKRTKTVQKQLDTLFPGLWLTEIHADFYKVPEGPETGKY